MGCCGELEAQSRPHHAPPVNAPTYHENIIRPSVNLNAGPNHPRVVQNAADQSFTPPRAEPSFSRLPPGCRRFSLFEVQAATGNFSDDAYIDQGGFGKVYRGTLEDGTMVAVKTLDRKGLQGDKEFEVEINVLARLRHKHLVTLRGACTENGNRIAVFDFMPGGSLRDNLDRRRQSISCWQSPRQNLLWPARIEVALGAAKGLRFLHEGIEPGMIHRDVKSSNFLLDNEGQVRIADFGLAIHTGEMSGKTAFQFQTPPLADADILTGTYGYTAPEYADNGVMSQKSDVYAFGVVLLELMTGMEPVGADRPEGQQLLADYLFPKISATYPDFEALQALLDPVIPKESVPVPQLMWFCEVASGCLQPQAKDRLRMSEVVQYLAKLDGWKQTPPQATASGRRVSTSDRTENGRYTLQSLMDDTPLSLPPLREGIDLVPLPSGIPTGYPSINSTAVPAQLELGSVPSGNPFAPNPFASLPAAFGSSNNPTQRTTYDVPGGTPDSEGRTAQFSTTPPSLRPPEEATETHPGIDETYSPLRASITGFSGKPFTSGHRLDAYAYDSGNIGPLQNGIQHDFNVNESSGGDANSRARALFPTS